jgi:hypothetical protein
VEVVTLSATQSLTNKTIDGDNNTISNLDIGNEVDWAAAADVSDRTAFASGDKLLIFEAGVGLRKIDYDDLPGSGGGISNIVEDTTPQLGGMLDVNGFSLGDGTLKLLDFVETGSAVNYLVITNAATAGSPSITFTGSDADVYGAIYCKGTSGLTILDDSTNQIAEFLDSASGVNYLRLTNAATGNGPIISALGPDSNIDLRLNPKGTGKVVIDGGLQFNDSGAEIIYDSAGDELLKFTSPASAVNYFDLGSAATGNAVYLSANGDDADIDIDLYPKGTGGVNLAWQSANYISVKGATTGNDVTISAQGSDANVDIDIQSKGSGNVLINGTEAADISSSQTLNNKTLNDPYIGLILDLADGNNILSLSGVASAVNYINIVNNITANAPRIEAVGDDANIDLLLNAKGNGDVLVGNTFEAPGAVKTPAIWSTTNAAAVLKITGVASAFNELTISNAATGNDVVISTTGIDANVDLDIQPKGTGRLLYNGVEVSTGGISELLDDTSPQLGGMLDVNGQAIGDGTRELLTFVEDASAVNHIEIENEATGSGPIIRAAGDDATIDLNITPKGASGRVLINGGGLQLNGVGADTIYDYNGNELLDLSPNASAVNYVKIGSSATGGALVIEGEGTDANIDMTLAGKGTGQVRLYSDNIRIGDGIGTINFIDTSNNEILALAGIASAVNFVQIASATTGNDVVISTQGDDANIDLDIQPKGTGKLLYNGAEVSTGGISQLLDDTSPQLGGMLDVNGQAIGDGTRELLTFVEDVSAVNHVEIENEATGSGPIIRAAGDDANVDLILDAKGTGKVRIDGGGLKFEDTAADVIYDSNDNELLEFGVTASAVNHINITNNSIGNRPTIVSAGDDTNIDLNLDAKGTGKIYLSSPLRSISSQFTIFDLSDNELFEMYYTASAVNHIRVLNNTTTNGPVLSAQGGDTNIDLVLNAKGTGSITNGTSDLALAQHYRELSIPAAAWYPDDTNPPEFSSVQSTDAYAFDAGTEESIYISFRLPDDYNGGVLRWSVDWDAVATASGTAVFGLSGGAFDDSDALSTALGIERTVTDTLLTVGDRHKSPNDATGITLAGTPAGGDWVRLKLAVKTSGTIAVDVLFLGLQIQYQTKTTQTAVWT